MKDALPALIGVIHLPALAGAPGAGEMSPSEALHRAGLLAVREASELARAGFGGVILENFGDTPFYKDRVPAETIASLAVIAAAVREAVRLPIGINVLRNDSSSALAIASVTGCEMIRVNVLSGVAATDQGMIEGRAAELIRERERLRAEPRVSILADIHVKHAKTLSSDDIVLALEETALRARADAVILTGATTGRSVDLDELKLVGAAAREHKVPLYIGSGARRNNLEALLAHAHGVIVGSDLRKGGRAGAALDLKRVREFAAAFRKAKKRK